MNESLPATQPHGSLVPPPGGPLTAIATAAPLPPRPNRVSTKRRTGFMAFVNRTFERLDTLADSIAELAGLR